MYLRILPLNEKTKEIYATHTTYHSGDAGLDFFAHEPLELEYGDMKMIKLGIKVAAYASKKAYEEGATSIAWLLLPRSSISKSPLRQCNSIGLIDGGYRGEVMMAVDHVKPKWNGIQINGESSSKFCVAPGDRFCQGVAFSGMEITFDVVESLDETSRGDQGFGSTTTNKKEDSPKENSIHETEEAKGVKRPREETEELNAKAEIA